jgi:subtilisin family serine protease
MHVEPKPHISPALAHLRYGVTTCALVVALCAALQMLVFGFLHFTEVRWVEPKTDAEAMPLQVVSGQPPIAGTGPGVEKAAPGQVAVARAISPAVGQPPVKPPRNLGSTDALLHTISDTAVTAGVLAVSLLAVFSVLGVVIAAGASVPGVAPATSAATWALLAAAACVPWQSVMPAVPYSGAFGSYTTMSTMSIAVDKGSGSALTLLVHFLLLPMGVIGIAFLAIYRFRDGVAEGIIVTSVSELDDRLEKEMAGIRSRGPQAAQSVRAVAALNHAIGEAPQPLPPPVPPAAPVEPIRQAAPAAAPAAAASKPGRDWMNRERRMGQPDAGDPMKRPI